MTVLLTSAMTNTSGNPAIAFRIAGRVLCELPPVVPAGLPLVRHSFGLDLFQYARDTAVRT